MPLDVNSYDQQVAAEGSGGGGNGAFAGRVGIGSTLALWAIPTEEEGLSNADLSQFYQDVFTKQGQPPSLSDKQLIYALVISSPGEGSKAFMPYGWDGDWSKVEHEETLAHAAKFGKGRRVIPLSLPKTLHESAWGIAKEMDVEDAFTVVNFTTGAIVSRGAIFILNRTGEGQKSTKYTASLMSKKADIAKVDAVFPVGAIVTPPVERLADAAEKIRTAASEKARGASPTAAPATQF